jgi:8-oxo-dGTP diphosphatase
MTESNSGTRTVNPICVGAVVLSDSAILLVRQAKGHSLEGQWTIPWGRIGSGESASVAAEREVREEGGIESRIDGLLGVQELPAPWEGQIGILYLCRHLSGEPRPDGYFSENDMMELAEPIEPLSRWLSQRVLNGRYTLTRLSTETPFAPSLGYL